MTKRESLFVLFVSMLACGLPAVETLNNLPEANAAIPFQGPGPGFGFGRQFVTGPRSAMLTSVTLEQRQLEPGPLSPSFVVALYEVDEFDFVQPVCELPHTMIVGTSGEANHVAYLPEGQVVLKANSRYMVGAMELSNGPQNGEVLLAFTSSEHYTGCTGWSFDQDYLYFYMFDTDVWFPLPASDHLKIRIDTAPDTSTAYASASTLWPPNGRMVPFEIQGVTDIAGHPVVLTVDAIFQDEPVRGGRNATSPDGVISTGGTGMVRAERLGNSNGRVYSVLFTADDGYPGGVSKGVVQISVPHADNAVPAVDDDAKYDSTSTN